MGAAALTLSRSQYAIHGTNMPGSIGGFVSYGCIRMLNEDVENLYERVKVGTKVVVLPGNSPQPQAAASPTSKAMARVERPEWSTRDGTRWSRPVPTNT